MRRFSHPIILLLVCLLLVGSLPAAAQEDTERQNKETYRNALALASTGDADSFYQLFPDHYELMGQEVSRQDTLETWLNALMSAIPDLQIVPEVIIAQDDLLAASVTYSGTFAEPFNSAQMGANPFPPTNQPVQWTEMTFLRFNDDGKIVENWTVSDPGGMLTQLGIIPRQEGGAPPPTNPLTDPVGYRTLSEDELATTFTSGFEVRNTSAWLDSIQILTDVDTIYTDPYILRVQNLPVMEQHQGQSDAGGGFIGLIFAAMPDLTAIPEMMVAEGDWVASLLTFSGTFTNEVNLGPDMTLTPTGQTVEWRLGFIDRFNADGQIIEEWSADDPTTLLQGLGLKPPSNS